MDECLYKLHKCEASCINTPGSYKCSCPYGQVLASDGYGCIHCANDTSRTNYTEIQPPRVINGNENVWHVAICGTNSTTCSGSLINDNFVITSASCVCDQVTFPQSLMVKMNKKFGCQTQELGSVDYSVTQIICHPMYNDTTLAYNVALLKLGRTVDTSIFKPVCFPTDRDQRITSINRFSGVHGYDYVGSSSTHNDIIATGVTEELYIQVTEIVSIKECYTAYGFVVLVDNEMMCTSKYGISDYVQNVCDSVTLSVNQYSIPNYVTESCRAVILFQVMALLQPELATFIFFVIINFFRTGMMM